MPLQGLSRYEKLSTRDSDNRKLPTVAGGKQAIQLVNSLTLKRPILRWARLQQIKEMAQFAAHCFQICHVASTISLNISQDRREA